jgi:glycosyltransferase involved in cell wall biosynthesis
MRPVLRVVSVVEGTGVSGPIKPLMMFAGLARQGGDGRPAVNLSLMTTVRAKGLPYPTNLLLTAAAEAGIHVDVLLERRAWDLGVLPQLCRVIEEQKPDIVETHQVKCHFILAQALWWRRIKKDFSWIAYHHGYTKASLKLRFYEALDRWSLRRPDGVVTVCRPFAEELIRHGAAADRVSVIPNTVQARARPGAQELAELRQRLALNDSDCVILSVGRLSPEKGHIDLIRAFKALLSASTGRQRPKLLMLGDGPKRQRLESAAADLGDRICLLGHQANVWPYYFVADIFVLPSHTEGSPLVLFEAMAAERAIVATTVGGVPETVEDGVSALLVPPREIARLTEALRSLCADPDQRAHLARTAFDTLKNFAPEAYRDRILNLYRQLTAVV